MTNTPKQKHFSRRDFFCSLAASFVAIQGVKNLPVGFPKKFPYVTHSQTEYILPAVGASGVTPKIIIHIDSLHTEFGVIKTIVKEEFRGRDIRTGKEVVEYG